MAGFFSKVFGGKSSDADAEKPAEQHSNTPTQNASLAAPVSNLEDFGKFRVVDLDQVRAQEVAAAAAAATHEQKSTETTPVTPGDAPLAPTTVDPPSSPLRLPSNAHSSPPTPQTAPAEPTTASAATNNSGNNSSNNNNNSGSNNGTSSTMAATAATATASSLSSSTSSISLSPLNSNLSITTTSGDASHSVCLYAPEEVHDEHSPSTPSAVSAIAVPVIPAAEITLRSPEISVLVASSSSASPISASVLTARPSEPLDVHLPASTTSSSASPTPPHPSSSSSFSTGPLLPPLNEEEDPEDTEISSASVSGSPLSPVIGTPTAPSISTADSAPLTSSLVIPCARAFTTSSSGSLSAFPPHILSATPTTTDPVTTKSRSSTFSIALSDVSTFSSSYSTTSTALSDYTPSPSLSRSGSPCPPTPATFTTNPTPSSSGTLTFPLLSLSASATARTRAYSLASTSSSISSTGRSRYNKQELQAARQKRASSKSVSFPGATGGRDSASARASGELRNRFKRSASSPAQPAAETVGGSNPAEKPKEGLVRMAFAEQQRWITVQQKTFTKWLNTKIEVRNLQVNDLVKDLSDGVLLIHLLECLSGESLGRYASKPKLRVQRFENANLALDFIKSRGIQMTNIGAEDVVDGNRKIILGLIWTLILRFTINDINEEGMTAKEGLLLWCQRKTACYDEVDVRDFSTSWNDGLAFCALLDIHRPDLIDYDSLDKSDHRGNMLLAFDIAHKEIGIPKLLDVEDVCDVAKPDERSLMTYIAYWFHAFSQMEKVENAGRRVEKFVLNMQGAWEMQSAYERRMAALLAALAAQQESWATATFAGTYADAKAQASQFAAYKRGLKREWVAEKSELATLLGNIKTKLGTYRLRPYEPPAHLSLENMEVKWGQMSKAEMTRAQLINETIRDIKNALRKSFADKANDFALALNAMQLAISGLEGDVEDQMVLAKQLSLKIPPLDAYLETIESVDRQCQEANIEENDFTTYTLDELVYELGLVKSSVQKKLSFLENQMVARNMTNLTPIQLEEFESVFRYFDRTDSNSLTELEFSAALASLGLVFSEDEMHDYFTETSHGRDRVTFEQFIRFMVEVTEDQNSAEQVFQSFREVADGKPYVTEMDLRHSLVPDEVIEKLTEIMPQHSGPDVQADRGVPQYDYIAFMDKMMADVDDSIYDDELEGDSLGSEELTGEDELEEGEEGESFESSRAE